MELETAKRIAESVKTKLEPYCTKIEIAGSIRRRKPSGIHDVDIVLIPANQGRFITACQDIGKLSTRGGLQLFLPAAWLCAVVDLYIASPATWATLLLIRTGSKEHNIKLCKRAKAYLSGILKADGSGLFKPANCEEMQRVAGDTEESIFAALGLPYKEPWERN